MANYTKIVDFDVKDGLPTGDPGKIIKGTEFEAEFDAISAAIATKADQAGPTFTGTTTFGAVNVTGSFTSLGIDDNATSTAITIDAGEDVGIGTTTPDSKLHLKDSNAILTMEHAAGLSSRLYFEDETAGKWGGIKATYGTGGATKEISLAPGDGTGDARFGGLAVTPTTATVGGDFQDTDLIVSGGGQVGIGAASLGNYKLNVVGTGFFLGRFETTGTSGAIYVGTGSGSGSLAYYDSGERISLKTPGRMAFDIGEGTQPATFRWNNAQDANTDSNNEQMRLTANGTLALGTTSPNADARLQLVATATNGLNGSGLIRLQNTVTNTASIAFDNATNDWSCGVNSGGNWNVFNSTSSATPFIINTAAPASSLRVESDSVRIGGNTSAPGFGNTSVGASIQYDGRGFFSTDNSSAAAIINRIGAGPITYLSQDGSIQGRIEVDVAANLLTFRTVGTNDLLLANGSSEGITIQDTTGNVGIGTTSPNWIASGTQTSQGVLSLGTTDTAVVTGDVIGALSFVSPDGSYTAIYNDGVGAQIAAVTESSVGGSYGLAFSTGTTTGTNRAERVRIDAVGNVGIGDTSRLSFLTNPSGNLQLTGGLISDPGAGIPLEIANYRSEPITFSTSGNIERMRIDSSGDVGIGTDSPVSYQTGPALNIGSTSDAFAQLNFTTATNGIQYIGFGDATTGSARYQGLIQFDHNNNTMGFGTGAKVAADVTIDASGNVGIGETVPARKLHVGDAMRLEPTSTPTSPSAGDLYFDSTTNKLRCYDGTTWQDCF
jgi:hypothetical protein